MREQTLSLIKPDAMSKNLIGEIINRYERSGLKIVALKMVRLTKERAEALYAIHRERAFFDRLTTFISSGPVVVMVLEGEDAIQKNRKIIGATDPKAAAPGTLRREFGTDIERNVVHGSDSQESADFEIPFFFDSREIVRKASFS